MDSQEKIPWRYDPSNPFSGGVNTYLPSDVQRHIRDTGGRRTVEGQLDQARTMSINPQAMAERMEKLSNLKPARTRESIMNPDPYEARMTGDAEGMQKTSSFFGGPIMPGLAQGGIPVYTDPLNSPSRAGIPTWNEDMPQDERQEMQRLSRAWAKWYRKNHYLVPTCFNIYSLYPFVGMDLVAPDPVIEDEYRTQFFDILKYHERLPLAADQYWVTGEAALLGLWDPSFKGWEEEQLLDSNFIEVRRLPVPTLSREAFFWYPPPELKKILEEADWENPHYRAIVENFPDRVKDWKEGKPDELPGDVFSLLRHDMDVGGDRGYPLLMQAFGALMQEEKLNQAMTAVADRLYTPFIVAKLGGKDVLPEGEVYVPDQSELEAMQAQLEMIMSSRYRLMVYHSGIQFENPFAGMNVPDLNDDFNRVAQQITGIFGISLDLIYGGSSGAYASGALNAEIMMQRLAAVQRIWTDWWIRDRAKKVAEERGYYVTERKGLQTVQVMERVPIKVWDGTRYITRIKEQRKLQLPGIRLETMNFRDHQERFNNLLMLKRMQIPVPDSTLLKAVDPEIDTDDLLQKWVEEQEVKAQAAQETQTPQQQQGGQGQQGPQNPTGPGVPQGPPGPGRQPGLGPRSIPLGTPGQDQSQGMGGPQRSPLSDNQRINEMPPQGQHPPQPGLHAASLEDAPIHFTKSGSKEEINAELGEMTEEEIQERRRKTALFVSDSSTTSNALSYAQDHMFTHFKKRGTKRGTLYFMNRDQLQARDVE